MRQSKKRLLSRGVTAGLLALTIGLLTFAGIGTARAALSQFSPKFTAKLKTAAISVEIRQDCEITDETKIVLDKTYKDNLKAYNTGNANAYIRVTIYKYWTNKDGKKCSVDPSLIDLNLVKTLWKEDPASTPEKTVLYSVRAIGAGKTATFADTLRIDGKAVKLDEVTQVPNGSEIVTTFDYNGISYHIDVEVDAVQAHNAEAAIKSAWGIDAKALGINITE